MKQLRVAIVGAGLMGRWHAQAAHRLGAEVVAVVDSHLPPAQALARHFPRAECFTDLERCLTAKSIDVVHVCTPLSSHTQLIETALRSGCHVLAEKPLAPSLQETEDLLQLAHEQHLLLNPIHQYPFQAGFQQILEQVHQLGDIVRVVHSTCSGGGIDQDELSRRSILLDIVPHSVSLFHHLFENCFDACPSEFAELIAWQVLQFTDQDLELVAQCGETQLSIVLSLRGRPTSNELRIVGSQTSAYADLFHGYSIFEKGHVSRQAKITKPFRLGTQLLIGASSNLVHRSIRSEPAYPGLRELIKRFYLAVSDAALPPISKAEILSVARLRDNIRSEVEGSI